MGKPTRIIDLPVLSTLATGDQIPVYSASNGDARRIPASALATYVSSQVATVDNKVTQYASPSASPFTVTVSPPSNGTSMWLILTPTGALATGTINLPGDGNAQDRQEILINCTQAVTTLTVAATGSTVTGAPTTLAANAFFLMRYNLTNKTWYRVG